MAKSYSEYRDKEKARLVAKKYRESEKGRLNIQKQQRTEKGKATNKRYRDKQIASGKLATYCRDRMKNDIHYKLRMLYGSRIRYALVKGVMKSTSTQELLGCDFITLKTHLESQFQPGMTWENYGRGGWHVDHIKPCASFDLTNPEEQKKCFHYSNLQPLWEKDNLSKGSKYA